MLEVCGEIVRAHMGQDGGDDDWGDVPTMMRFVHNVGVCGVKEDEGERFVGA